MWRNCAEILLILLTTLILSCNGFWWRSSTEATPTVKQIPVGYFRTYTYHQPMAYPGSFLNAPFGGSQANRFAGWSQFPSSSNTAPILSNYKYDTPAPTTTPPTPAPTPQSTTQPPTQPPQPPPPQQISTNLISTAIGHTFVDSHQQPPSVQHISSGPMRPGYPAHDFSKYQYMYPNSVAAQQHQQPKPMQQVRFVPCMCPVTVTISSDYPENRSASLDDDDMDLPESENLDDVKLKENGDDALAD